MKVFFEEYGGLVVSIIIGLGLLSMLLAYTYRNTDLKNSVVPDEKLMTLEFLDNTEVMDSEKMPVLDVEEKVVVYFGETYDPTSEKIIKCATDGNGNTVSRFNLVALKDARKKLKYKDNVINITGADAVGTASKGEYDVTYYYYNSRTRYSAEATCHVLVRPAYYQCDYIRTDGSQWIDTGITPDSDTTMYIKVKLGNTGSQYIAGISDKTSGASLKYGVFVDSSGKWAYSYGDESEAVCHSSSVSADTKVQTLMLGDGFFRVSSVVNETIPSASQSGGGHIRLFAAGAFSSMSGEFYSCQIYKGGVLVRDFIPCYGKASQEFGIWDRVENRFYPNQGQGTFIEGPASE